MSAWKSAPTWRMTPTAPWPRPKQLWQRVDRPNLMVKIPATKAGIPAIYDAIAAGINVNVTLIFSLERYAEVMDAYLAGLEKRVDAGCRSDRSLRWPPSLSRGSTPMWMPACRRSSAPADRRLEKATALLGKAAIANARLAYADFKRSLWQRSASRSSRPWERRSSARCGPRPAPRTRPTGM